MAAHRPFAKRVNQLAQGAGGMLSQSGHAFAVSDQLLIEDTLLNNQQLSGTAIEAWLTAHQVDAVRIGGVFDFVATPFPTRAINVSIFQLTFPNPQQNVFTVTSGLRAHPAVGDPAKISPNHLLVPAALEDFCPFNAPSPATAAQLAAYWQSFSAFENGKSDAVSVRRRDDTTVDVTVIDAGYQWNPNPGAASWGANPLDGNLVGEVEADVLVPGVAANWQPGPADVTVWGPADQWHSPDTVGGADGPLVALAGHANFVAGAIAQGCPNARITIRNLNGAFNTQNPNELPTEAAITRAIAASSAQVINVSFAGALYENVPGLSWAGALERLASGTVVVAPAGNEKSATPRFPAALHSTFPQVVGVASHKPGGAQPHPWTNRGSWVTCSSDGADVVSDFLHVKQQLEDADDPTQVFPFSDSVATWSGTCFAAAKVSAQICNQLVSGPPSNWNAPPAPFTASDAWNALIGAYPGAPSTLIEDPVVGIPFKF